MIIGCKVGIVDGLGHGSQAVGTERLTLREQEVGTPVFIDEQLHSCLRAAATVYELKKKKIRRRPAQGLGVLVRWETVARSGVVLEC